MLRPKAPVPHAAVPADLSEAFRFAMEQGVLFHQRLLTLLEVPYSRKRQNALGYTLYASYTDAYFYALKGQDKSWVMQEKNPTIGVFNSRF